MKTHNQENMTVLAFKPVARRDIEEILLKLRVTGVYSAESLANIDETIVAYKSEQADPDKPEVIFLFGPKNPNNPDQMRVTSFVISDYHETWTDKDYLEGTGHDMLVFDENGGLVGEVIINS